MNFAINPISSNNSSIVSLVSAYKQTAANALEVSSVVYESLEYLTGLKNSVTLQSLKDLKQTLENENLTGYSAYRLVDTIINRFDALSSDGKTITKSDFTGAVSFSVAQTFSSNSAVGVILKKSGISVSDAVKQLFGSQNAQTQAFIQFVDSMTDNTLSKLTSSIESSQNKEKSQAKQEDVKKLKGYITNPILQNKAIKANYSLGTVEFIV